MRQYRFTSAALSELRQATLYYEQRENGLGTAFLDEIEATLARILSNPPLGACYRREQDAVEHRFVLMKFSSLQ